MKYAYWIVVVVKLLDIIADTQRSVESEDARAMQQVTADNVFEHVLCIIE